MAEGLDKRSVKTKRVALDGVCFDLYVVRLEEELNVLVEATDKTPGLASRNAVTYLNLVDDA